MSISYLFVRATDSVFLSFFLILWQHCHPNDRAWIVFSIVTIIIIFYSFIQWADYWHTFNCWWPYVLCSACNIMAHADFLSFPHVSPNLPITVNMLTVRSASSLLCNDSTCRKADHCFSMAGRLCRARNCESIWSPRSCLAFNTKLDTGLLWSLSTRDLRHTLSNSAHQITCFKCIFSLPNEKIRVLSSVTTWNAIYLLVFCSDSILYDVQRALPAFLFRGANIKDFTIVMCSCSFFLKQLVLLFSGHIGYYE